MIGITFKYIAPVVFLIILGFFAGHKQFISAEGAKNFSTYVVNFALPCTLFTGIFSFSEAQLENFPFVITILLPLVSTFLIGALFGFFVMKKSVPETGLFACNCGYPDMAYFGLPILTTIIGTQGLLPVIIGNLVTSILVVPCVIFMIHHGPTESNDKADPSSLKTTILHTMMQPVVWAPIAGLILVLMHINIPSMVLAPFKLIGNSTGAVALFTLGVLLSHIRLRVDLSAIVVVVLKNFLMPLIAFLISRFFHLEGQLARGAIITVACPSATFGAMLSAKYKIGQNTIPAEIFASNIAGIFSMGIWLYVTGL